MTIADCVRWSIMAVLICSAPAFADNNQAYFVQFEGGVIYKGYIVGNMFTKCPPPSSKSMPYDSKTATIIGPTSCDSEFAEFYARISKQSYGKPSVLTWTSGNALVLKRASPTAQQAYQKLDDGTNVKVGITSKSGAEAVITSLKPL